MPVLTPAARDGAIESDSTGVLAATHHALDGLHVTDLLAGGQADVVLDLELGSTVLQLFDGRVVCLQPDTAGTAMPAGAACLVGAYGTLRLDEPGTRLAVLEFAPELLALDDVPVPRFPHDDAAARYHRDSVRFLLEVLGGDEPVTAAVGRELASHAASVARFAFGQQSMM